MDKIKKYNVVRFRDEAEQIRFPVAVLALNHPTYVDRLSRAPRIVAWSTLENTLGDDNTYYMSPGATDFFAEEMGLRFEVIGEMAAGDLPPKRILCMGAQSDWRDTGPIDPLDF
jgi:hypothetical protein